MAEIRKLLLIILLITTSACGEFQSKIELDSSVEQSSLSSKGSSFMETIPQVCEIQPGDSTCTIRVRFSHSGKSCLWVSETQKKITCSNSSKEISLSWITKDVQNIELRVDGDTWDSSQQLVKQQVLGVFKDTKIDNYIEEDVREKRFFKYVSKQVGLSTSSWDGRLQFGTAGMGGSLGLVVRVFKPEKLEGLKQNDINLDDQSHYSDFYLIDSDLYGYSDAQKQEQYDRLTNLKFGGLDANFDKGHLKAGIGFHLAIYPHGNLPANPYPSSAGGGFMANGNYLTYRFYAIMPTSWANNVESPYYVTHSNPNSGKKNFLTKAQIQVVVSKPFTENAKIHSTKIITEATPLKDKNNNLIHGYEASTTLDGRLIVYSANYKPELNDGNGGTVGYIYHQNSQSNTGWSIPHNLAEMYYINGPGAKTETVLNGRKFSERFPIAKKPIKEFNGIEFTKNDIIKGSYPWVSFDGSEALFSSVTGFHGASRHGVTVVGKRTNYVLRRIDGQMDPVRGSVIDRIYYDGSDPEEGQEISTNQLLSDSYDQQIYPNTGAAFGNEAWKSILLVPLGQFPSSWNPFSQQDNPSFPLNPFEQSYGFYMTGGRYAEVHFPNLRDDLLLYYPMNEAYEYDRELVNNQIKTSNKVSTPDYKLKSLTYRNDVTPDYSGNSQTGYLYSEAKFPYEYHDAYNQWNDKEILKDRNEGLNGNSIIMKKGGLVYTLLKEDVAKKIKGNNSFSFSFWFKKTEAGKLKLVNITDLLTVYSNDTNVDGRVLTDAGDVPENRFMIGNVLPKGQWNHVAVTYRANRVKIYINRVLVIEQSIKGNILNKKPLSEIYLELGPYDSPVNGQIVSMDEVYLYGIELPAREVETLAYIKRKKQEAILNQSQVNLGREVFNLRDISRQRSVSCSTCHQADKVFTDGLETSVGFKNKVGKLNAPLITDLSQSKNYHMSGNIDSLKTQALHPLLNPKEMGNPNLVNSMKRLNKALGNNFKNVFGKEADTDLFAQVIAQYVGSLKSTGSNPLSTPLSSDSAERGRILFNGKANCTSCHAGSKLTDHKLHDVGLGFDSKSTFGNGSTSQSDTLERATKTPSLINISKTAPYFHDGRFNSLEEVVEHYNQGPSSNLDRNISDAIRPLDLTSQDIADIVNYLNSLDRNYLD